MGRAKYVFNPQADVKVLFEFNGKHRYAIADGFRTLHQMDDNLAVIGRHTFYCTQFVPPKGRANGEITFLATDALPPCLWEGKYIPILEKGQIIGHAQVMETFNQSLVTEPK